MSYREIKLSLPPGFLIEETEDRYYARVPSFLPLGPFDSDTIAASKAIEMINFTLRTQVARQI